LSARDAKLKELASAHGFDIDAELKAGGSYVPLLRHGSQIFISGQIPRVGDKVVVTGKLGGEVSLSNGQRAARICALRALALLRRELGTLDDVRQVLKLTVYVHSAPDFTQQTEVADGASTLLQQVLGAAGLHTRTSVGVVQLPKNAAVEVDLVATALPMQPTTGPQLGG
jgi:enamine deaminase RidA (YjgF/YER057c/UK114 family)